MLPIWKILAKIEVPENAKHFLDIIPGFFHATGALEQTFPVLVIFSSFFPKYFQIGVLLFEQTGDYFPLNASKAT